MRADPLAPRNNDQTRLRGLAACFARGLAGSFRPLQSEGAGNAGRPMRPIAACAGVVVERTRVSQVTPESPGIPRAMVYGLYVISPVIGLLTPSFAELPPRNLTPAPRRQDHTTSPSAFGIVRQRYRLRPSHPVPRP